ncbi:MAG: ATP-binding protein [Chloroflexi bacterium]|nr:ATP-binding protein [Chloroflexota bacterium]MBP8057353.1 ATP-binding protein [Chloroflexota bacterium]
MDVATLVEVVDTWLPETPFVRDGGSLLIMVGLPGTGKSSLVEEMQKQLACVIITTDRIRRFLPEKPTYTPLETVFVYEVCHALTELRLRQGQRVVFDGTNYIATQRQKLYSVAEQQGSALAICHVQVAKDIARRRLEGRFTAQRRHTDMSEADWAVYQWMVEAQEPVERPHLVLDTTDTPTAVLAWQLREYWLACEQTSVDEW